MRCGQGTVFLVLSCTILINICFGNETCSDNQRWNARKSSCVECRNCKPGSFRNLTQKDSGPTGVHGHTKCLPCSKCPTGTYSASSGCALCQNCTSLYREYDRVCSGGKDASCGSCLRGYKDTYKSTKLPCMPEIETQKPSSTEDSQPFFGSRKDDGDKTQINFEYQAVDSRLMKGSESSAELLKDNSMEQSSVENRDSSSLSTLSIVTLASVPAVSFVIVICFVIWRRARLEKRRQLLVPAKYEQLNLSKDSDIEVDADIENTEKKKPPDNSYCVRAEMENRGLAETRGELCDPVISQYSTHAVYFVLPSYSGDLYSIRRQKICRCQKTPNCECSKIASKCPAVIITESDKYITTVAEKVCHDPTDLFRNLKLGDAIIYQENNSRDRNPVEITEKELVTTLLNIWTQRQTDASLRDLLNALCDAEFHCICKEISSRYFSTCTETNNVKPVKRICDKTEETDSNESSNERQI